MSNFTLKFDEEYGLYRILNSDGICIDTTDNANRAQEIVDSYLNCKHTGASVELHEFDGGREVIIVCDYCLATAYFPTPENLDWSYE